MSDLRAVKPLSSGDRVYITGDHPWTQEAGELIVLEDYGPRSLAMRGWRVRLDNGTECYASASNIRRMQK